MIEDTRPTPAFYLIETKDNITDTTAQNLDPDAKKLDSLEERPRRSSKPAPVTGNDYQLADEEQEDANEEESAYHDLAAIMPIIRDNLPLFQGFVENLGK